MSLLHVWRIQATISRSTCQVNGGWELLQSGTSLFTWFKTVSVSTISDLSRTACNPPIYFKLYFLCDPSATRTQDTQIRNLLLYPTELRGHNFQITLWYFHRESNPDLKFRKLPVYPLTYGSIVLISISSLFISFSFNSFL